MDTYSWRFKGRAVDRLFRLVMNVSKPNGFRMSAAAPTELAVASRLGASAGSARCTSMNSQPVDYSHHWVKYDQGRAA
jgi:hypothetical protein